MKSTTIYNITQINNQINNLLDNNFGEIFIRGEISSFNLYPSGHAYFTLKDKLNEISCVFFNYNLEYEKIENTEVIIYGKLNIYNAKGRLQFIASNIHLQGEGALWNKYLKLKNKLETEGLFDIQKKKKLPSIPEKILIISSKQGAVVHDILNILNRRSPYLSILIEDTIVQGPKAVNSIVNALKKSSSTDADIIIIARGGGSLEDLMPFNDEKIIREIFNSSIPIISAVGHETDFTLCDFVSDKRASTPSEAAEICAPELSSLYRKISEIRTTINQKIENRLLRSSNLLKNLTLKLSSSNPLYKIKNYKNELDNNSNRFKSLISLKISNHRIMLEKFKKRIYQFNINEIKKKGFVILKKRNKIIKDIKELNINDEINIFMNNGKIKAKIDKLYNE